MAGKTKVAKEMRKQMLMILGAMVFILATMIILFTFFPPEGHIVGDTITEFKSSDSNKKNKQTIRKIESDNQ